MSDFERFLEGIKPANPARSEGRAPRVRKELAPVLESLAKAGLEVASLAGLRHSGKPWKHALPTLLEFLPKVTEPGAKEEIVRTLSVPWVGRAATPQLIAEFKSAEKDSSLAWAIGNALSIVDISGFEKEIIDLVKTAVFGSGRQMLVVALGKMRRKDAEDAALIALRDETLKLHAIDALSQMRATRALPALRAMLRDRKASVRKEAQKAIRRLERDSI